MASILLIEDGPGVGRQLTSLLAAAGHRVLRCGGGPTPLAACPLLRQGRCPLPDAAELLVFACPLALPLRGRSYRGSHLLRAYRAHPDYGRLPLVLVTVAPPHDLEGPGPTELVETFTDPAAVLAAINRLLQPLASPHPPRTTTTCVGRRPGKQVIPASTAAKLSVPLSLEPKGALSMPPALGRPTGSSARRGSPHHGAPSPVAKL